MSNYAINLNTISYDAFSKIYSLDKKFIGTKDYMGLAFFWGYEYKHYLRDASTSQRRRIHNKGLDKNLDFTKIGLKQWEVISDVLKIPVKEMLGKKYYKALKENKVPEDYLEACKWMEEVFYK